MNGMFFGIDESKIVNLETRKKENETFVNDIIHDVFGNEGDCYNSKLVRIGRPIIRDETDENEGEAFGEVVVSDK